MTAHGQWETSKITVTLSETLETVATIPTGGMEIIFVQLETSNHSALDQFTVQARSHKDASFVTFYDEAFEFVSTEGLLIGTSGDMTTIPENSSGWFMMDVRGIYQVNLQAAQAEGDPTALTIYFGGN